MALEVLSRITHQALRLRQVAPSYAFARKHILTSLLIGELSFSMHIFPVAFTLTGGKISLVGLMGLSEDGNLFVGQHDQWLGNYVPAALRAWPFSLQPNGTELEQIVTIASDSTNLSTTEGTPLFENGEPSKALNEIVHFLQNCALNQTQTDRALAAIIAADILVPWSAKATLPDGQPAAIEGLHQIDMQKFESLPDANFLTLRQEGALPVIYAHVYSLHNMANLERLAREKGPKIVPASVEISMLTDDYLKF